MSQSGRFKAGLSELRHAIGIVLVSLSFAEGAQEPGRRRPDRDRKSWLACAFDRQAARLDHSVIYLRVLRPSEGLAFARIDGRCRRLIYKLTRVRLLILDDFGTHSLIEEQHFHLFEIVEKRYRQTTLITACGQMASSPS
ncbi:MULTISPECIES: ATP-binding protein [Mesorhizobium]|uniref:ATP-binding protein n=1 Tax=Mesorhizobium TaxID=68287 RepID=UPI0024B69FBC|nr:MULTISPECIES: ATP-binding protein [Mesorhizobium]